MSSLNRKSIRVLLTLFFGIFALPELIFGTYLFACWIRIHTTSVYYVEYPYLASASILIAVGLLSLFGVVYGAWRRSFFGLLFAATVMLGLVTMVAIPDAIPHVMRSMPSDSNYLSAVGSFFRVWYEAHHSFPKDGPEFIEALKTGPVAWQYRVKSPPSMSFYSQNGVRLPYQVVVINNASGPRFDNLSDRPGVIYYSVTSDRQQFWVTMTGLGTDVSERATIKKAADQPHEKPWLITAAAKDYLSRKQ